MTKDEIIDACTRLKNANGNVEQIERRFPSKTKSLVAQIQDLIEEVLAMPTNTPQEREQREQAHRAVQGCIDYLGLRTAIELDTFLPAGKGGGGSRV